MSDTREYGQQHTRKSKEKLLIFLFWTSHRDRGNVRLRDRRPTLVGALLVGDAIAHDRDSVDGAAGVYAVVLWDAGKLLTRLTLGEDSRVRFMEVDFTDGCVREPRARLANELAAWRPEQSIGADKLRASLAAVHAVTDREHAELALRVQDIALEVGEESLWAQRWTSRGSLHIAARCIQVTDGMIWI